MSECTCDVGPADQIVHDGDCSTRCTFWARSHHSELVAQCDRPVGHQGDHRLNLYRGSPSQRRERGAEWPLPDPQCAEPERPAKFGCQYYYLDADRSCVLHAGHREHHKLTDGTVNAEGVREVLYRRVDSNPVLVHADGGTCHGTPLVDGRCPGCGIAPDMQSTELWSRGGIGKS